MPSPTESPILRHDALTLIALPNSIHIGRTYATAVLRGWGHLDDDFLADAQLVVSELLTNAVDALGFTDPRVVITARAVVRIYLSELSDCVLIEVWDPHPRIPHPRGMPPPDALRGRGLEIVRHLTRDSGYSVLPDGAHAGGKIVFATLPFPQEEPPRAP
ncbi:ATP-binding protein [Spongiactinospora rosea]|nr:ATP-binding protein [Spongiactinospora rosea]